MWCDYILYTDFQDKRCICVTLHLRWWGWWTSCYYIQFCRNDEELNKLFSRVTIAQGGVIPNIHAVLLPKDNKKAANADGSTPKSSSSTSSKKTKNSSEVDNAISQEL